MNPNLNEIIEECDTPSTSKMLMELRDLLVDIKNGKQHFGIGNYVRKHSFSYNLLAEIIGDNKRRSFGKIKRDPPILKILM